MQSAALNSTYTDFSGLNSMRAEARVDPQASLAQVAKQFEGIFIQMMLKSMRDASMGDELFDSDQSKLYRDMFDKQISLDMANSKGIGIADALVRQLSKNGPAKESSVELLNTKNTRREANVGGNVLPLHLARVKSKTENPNEQFAATSVPEKELPEAKRRFNSPEEFTQTILPYAQAAADELGVTPMVLVSQAALETGWGKSVIRHNNGSSSFNLFNIKADNRWNGDRVSKSTLEYDRGVAKYENASFRAYDSYADSFDDYVDFLRTNARYDSALQHNGDDELFIQNIHEAGYATDPNYANKVINILNRETIKEQAGINVENGDVVNGNV